MTIGQWMQLVGEWIVESHLLLMNEAMMECLDGSLVELVVAWARICGVHCKNSVVMFLWVESLEAGPSLASQLFLPLHLFMYSLNADNF